MKEAKSRNWRDSLQAKLVVVITLILVVFALVLSVISTQFIRYSTIEALQQSMQQTASISADRVSDYLRLKVALVQSIASRVGALYADDIVADYVDSDIAFLEKQMSSMAEAYGFDLLFAVDNQGFSRTGKHSNFNELAPLYYTAIAQEGESIYLSDMTTDSGALGGSVLNISAAIPNPQGRTIGVLVAKLDAAFLSELVAGINLGENGSTFVMNQDGVCIAHKDPQMCFGGALYEGYKDNPAYSSLNRLWDEMRAETEGFTTYEYEGDRLAAYATIEGTNNWALAVTADESEFMVTADRSILITVLVVAVFLVLAFLACLFYIRPIVSRISSVTRRLERLSDGDLTDDMPLEQNHDEVGRLALATGALVRDLSHMIDSISDVLSDMAVGNITTRLEGDFSGDFARLKGAVEQNLAKLGALVRQISATSEEVSRGSVQIAEGATSLAQGAAEQAGSIEELYRSVTELSGQARDISDPERRYLDENEPDGTEETETARLEAAPTLVDKLNAAMESIRLRLTEVGKITAVIDSIASETGMLALNASVEATHAGEYGRGFAVIASEVRELSDRAKQEARSSNLQVESILRAVTRGDQVVGFTIEAVAQMAASLSQVEATLSQISTVIEDTAATAQESAASSEELSAQAEMLRELASAFTYEEQNEAIE